MVRNVRKEIRITNFIFRNNNHINLLSIEEYLNYGFTKSKLKMIINGEYNEYVINILNVGNDKIEYDILSISPDKLSLNTENLFLEFKLDNTKLIKEYMRQTKHNTYIFLADSYYEGIIDENEVKDRILIDYEVITEVMDYGYKIYSIDFSEFNGSLAIASINRKLKNLYLAYKDIEYQTSKNAYIKTHKGSQIHRLRIYEKSYWKIKIQTIKRFKSTKAVIPFSYFIGSVSIVRKKALFKPNLKASNNEILMIHYEFA